MLKHVGVFSVVLALVAQTVFLPALALQLEINRSVMAARYCINRDKPMMNCNGSCVLARRLNEAMQQAQPTGAQTELITLSFSLPLYFQEAEVWQTAFASAEQTQLLPPYVFFRGSSACASIFKPPRQV